MKAIIGFNIICFVVSFIIIMLCDGTLKEKLMMICAEPFLMGLLSLGAYLVISEI